MIVDNKKSVEFYQENASKYDEVRFQGHREIAVLCLQRQALRLLLFPVQDSFRQGPGEIHKEVALKRNRNYERLFFCLSLSRELGLLDTCANRSHIVTGLFCIVSLTKGDLRRK